MRLGEEILRCRPYAYVVSQSKHRSVCDSCLIDTNERQLKKCMSCKYVYYCNRECQRRAWKLHREECKYLVACSPKVPTDTVRLMARIIIKLRMSGYSEVAKLPDGTFRRFDDLQSHTQEIIRDKERLDAFLAFFAVLQDIFKDTIPPKSEVLDIFGRVVINSFSLMDSQYLPIGTGLYLAGSVLDHSCEPNAAVIFDGPDLIVRCIKESPDLDFSQVRISYINTMHDTERRKTALRQQYYFECDCPACQTDCYYLDNLKVASMKCSGCTRPIHMRPDSREKQSITCSQCQATLPNDHIEKYWSLHDLVVDMRSSKDEPDGKLVELLQKMKGIFHPFDRAYSWVLEEAYEVCVKDEDWTNALQAAKELYKAYEKFYPRYDVRTAFLLLKMAYASTVVNIVPSVESERYALMAEDILKVTHGSQSSFFANFFTPFLANTQMALRE